VRAHHDLARLLRSWDLTVLSHPWVLGPRRDAAVMVSGNAMAHVYVELAHCERPWWPALARRWEWLAVQLLERESVDLLLLPHSSRECEVRARGRGSARVLLDGAGDGARYTYRPEVGNPLGVGSLTALSSEEVHDATAASPYPDGVVQIAHLAGSVRAGDLILSASPGWDFRNRWEPIPHASAHGALHRDHMVVPVLMSRAPSRAPRRTVDVMPSVLAALGRPIPPGLDGRSCIGALPPLLALTCSRR
jgi:hypothetical protein